MKSHRIREIAGRVYDNIEISLWAILLASVVFLAVFVVPTLPAIRAQYQKAHAQEIADETALYCKKLKIAPGTPAYGDCLLVLGDFRLKVEQRVSNEIDF